MKRTRPNIKQVNNLIDKHGALQIAGVLATRLASLERLGYQYSGDRDIYQVLGYKKNLEFSDYFAQYQRQDIAKAIINRPINATWRGDINILESNEEDETPLEKIWKQLEHDLHIKSILSRFDKLSHIGRYGVLLFGFDDIKSLGDFVLPVKGKRKLLYLKAFAEVNAEIAEWETSPNEPRYGKPKFYSLMSSNKEDGITDVGQSVKVHYSRVLHIAPNLLDSDVFGDPELKDVFNRLVDIEKLVGGSAEMFWRGARPGYHGKINPEFQLTQDVQDGLKDQLDEYEHNLRRIIIGQGIDEFKELSMQVADPGPHIDTQLKMISAVKGIPLRILTGSERGELASSQDRDSWFDKITERREEFAEPVILRPFIDKLQEHGILPFATEETFDIEWTDLWATSDKEKADVGHIRAMSLKEYSMSNQDIVSPEAFFRYFLGFSDEDAELIEEMSKEQMAMEQEDFDEESGDEILEEENVDTRKDKKEVEKVEKAEKKSESKTV